MKKLLLYLVLPLLIVGTVLWWITRGGSEEVTYRYGQVTRGDLTVAISATGTLEAVTTVQVGSQVSGTISKLYADFNSQVKEGQLLAQLDPTFLQASVNEQRANLDRASAQLNEAKRNFDRTSELQSRGLVSQADLDAATTSLESAKASLQQVQASLERAEVNLRYATIKAPISGVVISRDVDVGQTVAASLQAPTLFTIAEDLSRMQVEASIDEADIGNVKQGQKVTFRVDSYPEQEFEGQVSQIRLAPEITQNVVTYTVIIDVANPDLKLMPGMTATVSIEVEKRIDVLRVPLQALRFTPPNAGDFPVDRRPPQTADTAKPASAPGGVQAAPQANDSTGERKSRRRSERAQGEHQGMPKMGAPGEGGMRPRGDSERRPDSATGNGTRPTRARVWVMENGAPKPVPVLKGIQNQQFAELVDAPLQEGDSLVIGTTGNQGATGAQQQNQTNPFMPRMPGGPGGGGGRGR